MNKRVKIKIYKKLVKPIVVYESETWLLTEMDGKDCNRANIKDTWTSGRTINILWIRTDQQLQELYKM